MYKIKILTFKIKKIFIPSCICLFTLFLLIFSNENLLSAKSGLILWANSVVPSLLPFFIATELLGYTNIVSVLGRLLNKFMRPIFNIPGEGSFPFIMGIISGYPMGAKIVSKFKQQGICSKEEAERMLSFTNNSGPLFIIGTVGIGMFKDTNTGILLFITHILACLTVGFVFRWWKSGDKKRHESIEKSISNQELVSVSNLGEVLSKSIMSAINTVLLIGGFIVLFSVIVSILEKSNVLNMLSSFIYPILNFLGIPINYSNSILTGIIELTNGVAKVSLIPNKSISTSVIICSFLLGFGGISITLQILSVISKVKISIKPYLIGKLLQGIFAAIYTYLFLNFLPFIRLDL